MTNCAIVGSGLSIGGINIFIYYLKKEYPLYVLIIILIKDINKSINKMIKMKIIALFSCMLLLNA